MSNYLTLEDMKSNDEEILNHLQHDAFLYFLNEVNHSNGLIKDCTRLSFPSSIAALGMALAAYPVGVERKFLTRASAKEKTLTALRFLWKSKQGTELDATGYKGFYYHFLDMDTGRRAWKCELSTIDTMLLLAGALTSGLYFNRDTQDEREIRELADALFCRVDWQWALNGGLTVSHGWKPESGFLPYRWRGYDEATILYLFGLGSPTYPLPKESYPEYVSTYAWKSIYDYEFLYAGSLFIHQYSHVWIDFRAIQDEYMRDKGIDYFENSRRATYIQQQYAIRNPLDFGHHCKCCWGFTASDGPGPTTLTIDGIERQFYDYLARGVPYGPDDGTIAPWAAVTSLPFAPEIVLPTIKNMIQMGVADNTCPYGFASSFNSIFPGSAKLGWVSPWNYGIQQGPQVLMVENFRTGLIWNLLRRCPYLIKGLERAGFSGGWLETEKLKRS